MRTARTICLTLATVLLLSACQASDETVHTKRDTFAAIRAQLPLIKTPRGSNLLPDNLVNACDEIIRQANWNGSGPTELSEREVTVLIEAASSCVTDPWDTRILLKELLSGEFSDRD